MKTRFRHLPLIVLTLALLGSSLFEPHVSAQASQIQAALRQFLQTMNVWTGTQTFTNVVINGSCTGAGCSGGSGAPIDATYLTQTANASLSNEQAVGALSSGIMRVATSTGVVTSLTTSAGIFANISDETGGSGVLVGNVSPTLVTPILGTPTSGTLTNTTGFPVANLAGAGTGVLTALAINVGSAGAPVLFNGAGGTPSSMTATNLTGTASGLTAGSASAVAVGGITGLGTGIATALGINVGSAGAPVLFNGALGTPSSGVATNLTGTASGLTAGTASAVAVGGITGLGTGVATWLATPSSANFATAVTGETGSGALVFATSPTLVTPVLGVASATSVSFPSGNGVSFAGGGSPVTIVGGAVNTSTELTVDDPVDQYFLINFPSYVDWKIPGGITLYPQGFDNFDTFIAFDDGGQTLQLGLTPNAMIADTTSVTASVFVTPTEDMPQSTGHGVYALQARNIANADADDISELFALNAHVASANTGTTFAVYGVNSQQYNVSTGTMTSIYSFASDILNTGGGTIAKAYQFYGHDLMGKTTTAGYFLFYDGGAGADCNSGGVYRVNDFGISAYYNPCFTKYVGGATNFERIISRWGDTGVYGTDNIAYFGVEAGGTGTNRALELVGGGLRFNATLVSPASSGTRYLCISTAGVVTSSASACSGT